MSQAFTIGRYEVQVPLGEGAMGNEGFILYDSVGRIIKRGRCSNSIEVSDIPAGIYYLTIVDLPFSKTLKMVKR